MIGYEGNIGNVKKGCVGYGILDKKMLARNSNRVLHKSLSC